MEIRKSLLIPINSKNELLIQDRRGHKKPDWGYFGGSIEGNETPIEAVIRESREELCLDLKKEDLIYLGESKTVLEDKTIIRYLHLYPTEQETFDVREGKGGYWFSFEEVRKHIGDHFDEVAAMIKKIR